MLWRPAFVSETLGELATLGQALCKHDKLAQMIKQGKVPTDSAHQQGG